MMYRADLVLIGIIVGQSAFAQPVDITQLPDEISGEECVVEWAKVLEPTQESMFDLANLIVHSLCLDAKGRDLAITGQEHEQVWENQMMHLAGKTIVEMRAISLKMRSSK